jgi:hypothetical protein
MLNNFHLAALTKKGKQHQLFHIPLHQHLQDSLAETWGEQYDKFMNEIDEIDFDAGYMPEEHERFRLPDYELPDVLNDITSLTIHNQNAISSNEDQIDFIKAIVGFAQVSKGKELLLFQGFSQSHVIKPGRFLFLQNNTYVTAKHPGLNLDSKITAVYTPKDKKLLFLNFRMTNTFLPLAEFYKEASEEEIRDILGHDLLSPEDAEVLATGANQWFRKRFAMLRDSKILDTFSAKEIKKHSKEYDITINLDRDGKIVFPAEKKAAKKLLQFLNEEIFRGAITETLYETNSKREAD